MRAPGNGLNSTLEPLELANGKGRMKKTTSRWMMRRRGLEYKWRVKAGDTAAIEREEGRPGGHRHRSWLPMGREWQQGWLHLQQGANEERLGLLDERSSSPFGLVAGGAPLTLPFFFFLSIYTREVWTLDRRAFVRTDERCCQSV
jgi:hypothetical protein